MPRAIRLGAGLVLALFVVTCTDTSLTGPGRRAPAAFDVSSLVATQSQGDAPVPLDSFVLVLRRLADSSVALDTGIAVLGDTLHGDSAVVQVTVPLAAASETFAVTLQAVGAGIVWYEMGDTVTITSGGVARPPAVTARYVGPGANAAFFVILPQDTTVTGGAQVAYGATVYDGSQQVIAGVPVGYRLSDSTAGGFSYPTYTSALLSTVPRALPETVWAIAETPTHLTDSTQLVIDSTPAGAVARVVVTPKNDTVPVAALAAFSASLYDAAGIPVTGAVTWSSTAPAVASVDSFGVATGLANGTAGIVAAANGHADTATLVVTGSGQPLAFLDTGTVTLGVGQIIPYEYVEVTNPVAGDILIHLQRSDSAVVAAAPVFAFAPDTATMLANTNFAGPVRIVGQTAGTASLVASAPGYGTGLLPFAVGAPQLVAVPDTVQVWVNGRPMPLVVYTADQAGTVRQVALPLTVSDSVGDGTIAAVDSAAKVIDSLNYITTFNVGALQPGTTAIAVRASGYPTLTVPVVADSITIQFSGSTGSIGPNQYSDSNLVVYLNGLPAAPVTVTLQSSDSTVVSVPPSVTIDTTTLFAYVTIHGNALGSAQITATAPGLRAAAPLAMTVNQPALDVVPFGSGALGAPDTIVVYVVDSLGGLEKTSVPLTVTLASSDPTHVPLVSDTVTIPAGGASATFVATPDSAATYTLTATAPGYTPGTSFIIAATSPVPAGFSAPRAAPRFVAPRFVAPHFTVPRPRAPRTVRPGRIP